MNIPIKKLDERATLPTYGTDFSAGADLYALLPPGESVTIAPGETRLIPTGLSMAIPRGWAGLIFARSGLSVREGLAPANKVGVIDADYRGEVKVALYNQSRETRTVSHGDRVAQLAVVQIPRAEFAVTECLPETLRGEGGFGSTGK